MIIPRRITSACVACTSLGGVVSPALGQSFHLVGNLPGGVNTRAYAVSSDGRIAAGDGIGTDPALGWTWTREGGILPIAGPPGAQGSAQAISGDGSTTGGNIIGGAIWPAYRSRGSGMVDVINPLNGYNGATVLDLSGSGDVAVGYSEVRNSSFHQAFRWTPETGMVGMGYTRPGLHNQSHANAVSASGDVIVGSSSGPAYRPMRFGGRR